ncbi:hypothetical protein WG926_05755 [Tistrella sp. BH-R2-4]|uniref:Nucleotidyltransferase family protein n=1 Tax=Tistrella arctica TaxID=3133430 RepID=A0ABU9YGM9_9PROT
MFSGYRPAYLRALHVLAEASLRLKQAGVARPVLVGGAAVEFYSAAAFVSGDFDLVIPDQAALEAVLCEIGFERPDDGTRGLQHVALNIAVEVVGRALLDGMGAMDRVVAITVAPGLPLLFIGCEDLIADRVAQADAGRHLDQDRFAQAAVLYRMLGDRLDRSYLDQQIRQQAAGRTLAWFEGEVNARLG